MLRWGGLSRAGAAGATALARAPQEAAPETTGVVQVPDGECDPPREVARRRAARGGERASVSARHELAAATWGWMVFAQCHRTGGRVTGSTPQDRPSGGKVGEAPAPTLVKGPPTGSRLFLNVWVANA